MAFSKSSTVVAMVALMALAIEVGCGQPNNSSGTKNNRVDHNLQARGGIGAKNRVKNPKLAAADAKKADQGIQNLGNQETTLQAMGDVAVSDLVDGKYELKTIATYYNYKNSKENLSATNESKVIKSDVGAYQSIQSISHDTQGKMTLDSDTVQRKVDIPYSFTKEAGWTADWDHASNLMLENIFNSSTNTLSDTIPTAGMNQKASVFGIISSGTPEQGLYKAVDESNHNITLRVMRSTDEATLRIYMSIEEKAADQSGNLNGNSESIFRNIYLDYAITPATAAQ